MVRPPIITPSAIWAINSIGDEGHRFDLRFLRPFRADLSIKKSLSFFPPLIAATSQRGLAPRPAHVSPDGPRYFGGTFLPFGQGWPLPTAPIDTRAIIRQLCRTQAKYRGKPQGRPVGANHCKFLSSHPRVPDDGRDRALDGGRRKSSRYGHRDATMILI